MAFFNSPLKVFASAVLLRLTLLLYGLWQDAYSPLKYTDIDYYVFTDASRFLSQGLSPYNRETYRYTPLLAWLLLPTTWSPACFHFGKLLFAASDVVAGWLVVVILKKRGMTTARSLKFAAIWLLNPMVATISTRGSSEGLLGVLVIALLWAVLQKRVFLAGIFLGLGVHFKIYPFIYAPSIIWYLDNETLGRKTPSNLTLAARVQQFMNSERITLAVVSLIVFGGLNWGCYHLYGPPFLQQTYLHHITRIDHRHNFSPYNTLLYLSSSSPSSSKISFESLAFLPQLFLSAVAIPLVLAKKDLPSTMLAQTFAFVAFNKVCTSQYFLWYTIFLPLYLPTSSLLALSPMPSLSLSSPTPSPLSPTPSPSPSPTSSPSPSSSPTPSPRPYLGLTVLLAWILSQAFWLQQAFNLEFLGLSTFVPYLFLSSLLFFAVNCWILGIVVLDVGAREAVQEGEGVGKIGLRTQKGGREGSGLATGRRAELGGEVELKGDGVRR